MQLRIAVEAQRRGEHGKLHALFFGVLHFLQAGGHFGLGAAVDNVHAFRAHAQGGTGRVHGHVARAEYGDVFAGKGRGVLGGKVVGPAQVHTGQVFIGREHAHQVFAGHAQKGGQARAHADEHGVVVLAQIGHVHGAAAHAVKVEFHAGLTQSVDFRGHHALGQTEGGDAVNEHAARLVQGLKHVHPDARGGADARTGEGGGTGTDAGHLFAVQRQGAGIGARHLLAGRGGDVGVGHKTFQPADGHGLTLGLEHALAFTLVFLRADPAADRRQAVGAFDDAVGGVHIVLGHLVDEVADGHFHRAARDAEGLFALQATRGLLQGHFPGVAQGHFLKIAAAHRGGLTGHGRPGGHGLFGLASFHVWTSGRLQEKCVPVPGRRPDGGAVRENLLHARQIRGRPRRQIWSCRLRLRGRRRTYRCRPP